MENAELYTSANGMQKKDAKEVLDEFGRKIKWGKAARILDVGCGAGDVTTEILLPRIPKDFKELVGMDISLEMIQHARNLHSHPGVSFVQFDVAQNSENLLEDLTKILSTSRTFDLFPKEIKNPSPKTITTLKTLDSHETKLEFQGFDVIFSFYCLHWISDQRLAMRNMYRLLKSGGESVVVFLVKSPVFTLYRKLSTLKLWKEYMQDVDNFIPFYQDSDNPLEDFTEILSSTGFQILKMDDREKSYKFDNFSLRNAIIAVNPFLSRMSNDLQEEFIEECLRQIELLKLAEFKNNYYRVSYRLMVAHLRKPL